MAKRSSTNLGRVLNAYDQKALKRICELDEREFHRYGKRRMVDQEAPANILYHRNNGSNILAVAHLDTVAPAHTRTARFADTAAGPIVHSRALDDRLGAYIILDMLPRLGLRFDILLTTGEEAGRSTAGLFDSDKQYDWMIEFDRGGTDVVTYQYGDDETDKRVTSIGARVGMGSFSDISYLDHLGCKGFNWGVGYEDYHGPRSHAYLNDTFLMVTLFLEFHDRWADTFMPHDATAAVDPWGKWDTSWSGKWSSERDLSDLFSDSAIDLDELDDKEWEAYVEHRAAYEKHSVWDDTIPY